MTATDSPAEAAFRDYAASGDVTGFYALADYLDERDERKVFTKLLRSVAQKRDPDVLFFWQQATWSYNPKHETADERRLRGAVEMAKAEDWYEKNQTDSPPRRAHIGGLWFEWVEDAEYNQEAWDEQGEGADFAFVGVLRQWNNHDHGPHWDTLASLGGVQFGEGYQFPDGDPYARVVRAELCLEAMQAKRKRK